MSLLDSLINGFKTAVEGVRVGFANTSANLLSNYGDHLGYRGFANALDHYRLADGKDLIWPRQELERYPTILSSEKTNHDRFLNSLNTTNRLFKSVNGQKVPVRFYELKNNDHVFLDDYFDVDHIDNYKDIDPDFYRAFGRFKLHSKSNLEFVKSNNKLLPYGYVEHSINDVYDFNPGSILNLIFNPLEKIGQAHIYTNKSTWKTQPMGVINIHDNNLDTSGVEWNLLK